MNDRLLTLLLNQSSQILLLAVIFAFATRFIAKNRPHLAHAMWILVLIKCVTPPIWSSSFGVFSQLQILVDDETENSTPASEPSKFLPDTPLPTANAEPLIVETFQGIEPAIDPLPEFDDSTSPQAEITLAEEPTDDASIEFVAETPTIEQAITTVAEIEIGPSSWPQRLLIFVAVGAMLTLLIIVVRCVRCLRLIQRHRTTEFDDALNERLQQLAKQLNIGRVPRIVVSNVLFGPAVLGLLRHTIVLPRCLLSNELVPRLQPWNTLHLRLLPPVSALEARASDQCVPGLEPRNEEVTLSKRDLQFLDPILAHELLHIRRGDLRFGMLQVIAQSLWWFHPAVWFANRWLSREAERCCDEQVIAELGCTPGQYARSLLAVIESKHTLQPIPVFPGMKPVEITTQRMERIMSLKTGLNKRTPLWCWLAVAALAIVVLPGAVAKTAYDEATTADTDNNGPKSNSAQSTKADDRSMLSTTTFDVTDLLEQLSKDQNVHGDQARQLLVDYIKSAAPAMLETPTAHPFALNAAPLKSVPLPQPSAQLAQGQAEPTERNAVEPPKLKELSSIALDGNQVVVLHTKEGQLQVQNSLNQFRQFGFQQFLVSVQFITGPAEELKELIAELPDTHLVDDRPMADLKVLTSAESDKIVERVKDSDSTQLESASSVVAFNGQTAEIFTGVERPFVVGFEKGEPKLRLVKNGMTLSIESTLLDNGSLRLSCVAQSDDVTSVDMVSSKRPAVSAMPSQYQMPRVTSKRIQTAVELKVGLNLLIGGLSTYVAKDKATKPVVVLLKVREYVHTSPTASIRLADDFIPNSDMELDADSVVAYVGEKPITVDDLFSGAHRVFGGQAFDKFLGENVSIDNRQQLLMKAVVSRLPEYLHDEVIIKTLYDKISPQQRAAFIEDLVPSFEKVLENFRWDQGAANNEELDQLLRHDGFSLGQMRDSFMRIQIIVGYLQALPEGSPLREKEGILEHCHMLLESASRNATREDSVQQVSSTTSSSTAAASGKTQDVAETNPIDQAQKAVNSVEKRIHSTTNNTPWQIMQSVMAFGKDAMIDHNGTKVNTLDWIKAGPTFNEEPWPKDEPWFQKTEHGGRAHPYNRPYRFEGHPNQFTAWLAMCKLPLETIFQTPDGPITMQDLIKHAQMTVNAKDEVSWTLLALVSYLSLDAEWTNAAGEEWSIERLVKMETTANMERAPCGGTYRLFTLAVAGNAFLKTGKPLFGVWLEADEKINRYVEIAKAQQKADGRLSADYFRNRSERQSFGHPPLLSRGNLLQFLMAALPDERLKEAWVTAAIEATAKELEKRSSREIGPAEFYAAASAFRIYLDRVQPSVAQRLNKLHPDQIVARAAELISLEDVNGKNHTAEVVVQGKDADAKPKATEASVFVLMSYPVADLVAPILRNNEVGGSRPEAPHEAATEESGTVPEKSPVAQPAPPTTERAMSPVYTKEDFAPLVELIKASVEPESWGNKAVISPDVESKSLLIRQTFKAHDEITDLIIKLRKGQTANIQITSLLVKLTTDEQLKVTGEYDGFHSLADGMKWSLLTPKRSETLTKALLDQKPLVISSPRIMTISGQAAHVMVGSTDKSVFNGFSMTVTPQLVPDSSIIRLQHQISIGTDRQLDAANDATISASSFALVAQDQGNAGSVMHESLVGSGQTLLLLIERPRPDDAAKSVDRYVLLLTPEHLKEKEEKVHDSGEAETESSVKP